MVARGNPTNISLGPGLLYVAPLGSTVPIGLDDSWAVAWTLLGYTTDGSSQSYAPAYDDVAVAEELEPIDSIATGRTISVSFTLAELTSRNLKTAFNGGTITQVPIGTGITRAFTKFEPPDLGVETHTMIGFQAEDGLERIVWRDCKQTGTVEMTRRKGSDLAGIPTEFRAFKPVAGAVFTRYSARGTDGT